MILTNPTFADNPFSTIRTHAQNTLLPISSSRYTRLCTLILAQAIHDPLADWSPRVTNFTFSGGRGLW